MTDYFIGELLPTLSLMRGSFVCFDGERCV